MLKLHILLLLNWKQIFAIDDYIFRSKDFRGQIDRIKLAISALFFKKPSFPSHIPESDICFFKSLPRKDYDALFLSIYSTCDSMRKCQINLQQESVNKIRYTPLSICIKYFPLLFISFDVNLLLWFFRSVRMLEYLESFDKTKNYKFDKLVVFADMQPIDNMLVQIANYYGKQTVTLQHGLYVDYKDYENINTVNYANCVASYFLAWGQDTRALIKKYHPATQIFICGKPLEILEDNVKEAYLTVVFDQNIFLQYNFTLLEIAYEIAKFNSLKVNIRMHPHNVKDWFDINEELSLFDREIDKSQFVLGHTTSMLFECMCNDVAVFKLRSSIPTNFTTNDLIFEGTEDLLAKLNSNILETYDFKKESQYYIQNIGEESLSNYREFFERLGNGEI